MRNFFKQIFTDALGRPEIKNIFGFIFCIAAIVYLFISRDVIGTVSLGGFAVGLFGLTTYGDAKIDAAALGGKVGA